MEKPNVLAIFSLISLFIFDSVLSEELCSSGWTSYKDEKCLRIIESPGLSNYADAEKYCRQQYAANLLSIGSQEKQKFLEDIFTSKELADNIWISLKPTSNGTFEWSDGTDFNYENWAEGSPRNEPNHCVQIQSDEEEFGQWSNVLCTKKNVVLCEKDMVWSLARVQAVVMELRKKDSSVPVGFIYVQLPKEKSPEEIWSSVTWKDVSAEYENMFFRVEGSKTSPFGTIQEQTSPRITSVAANKNYESYPNLINISPNNEWSGYVHSGTHNENSYNAFRALAFKQSNDEVRPRNMAMRIWKRIE